MWERDSQGSAGAGGVGGEKGRWLESNQNEFHACETKNKFSSRQKKNGSPFAWAPAVGADGLPIHSTPPPSPIHSTPPPRR